MPLTRRSLLAGLLSAPALPWAQDGAVVVEGKAFARRVQVAGGELLLNGTGVRAVGRAHVGDGGTGSDIDRDPRRCVQNRSVLNVGALPNHDRRIIGAQHRVEPDRSAGLHGHIAH